MTRVVGTWQRPVEEHVGVVTCQGGVWFCADSSWSDEADQEKARTTWRQRLHQGWRLSAKRWSNPTSPRFTSGWIHRFGFHASLNENIGTKEQSRVINVVIPTWFVAGCTLILPGLWMLMMRRRTLTRRRLAAGLCATCGYDLRASRERCPECGAVPADSSPVRAATSP